MTTLTRSQAVTTEESTSQTPAISTKTLPPKLPQSPQKSNRRINKLQRPLSAHRRPQSATFGSSFRKVAILSNLEGTPPPILPSSVRGIGEPSRSVLTDRGEYRASSLRKTHPTHLMASRSEMRPQPRATRQHFFAPHHDIQHMESLSNRNRTHRNTAQSKSQSDEAGDIGKCGQNITYNFQPYGKIAGKKRNRSSSANSLELPAVSPKTLQQLEFTDINHNYNNNKNSKRGNNGMSIAMLMSPESTALLPLNSGTERSLSPRSLLRLGSHVATSPNSTQLIIIVVLVNH